MKNGPQGREELANELLGFLTQAEDSVSANSLPPQMSDTARDIWQTEMDANREAPPVKDLVALRERISRSSGRGLFGRLAPIGIGLMPATGAALAVVAALALFPVEQFIRLTALESNEWHEVDTKTSYKSTGIKIDVAGGSSVAHKSEDNHHFMLKKGEANFEIDKEQAGKPFVVWTPGGFVRTLGTKFSVDVEKKMQTVSVTDGQVAVHRAVKGGKYKVTILGDGDETTFKTKKKAKHHTIELETEVHDDIIEKEIKKTSAAADEVEENKPKKKTKKGSKESGPFAKAIGKSVVVKLDNGDVASGELLSAKGKSLKIKSKVGTIQVPKSEIESWKLKE